MREMSRGASPGKELLRARKKSLPQSHDTPSSGTQHQRRTGPLLQLSVNSLSLRHTRQALRSYLLTTQHSTTMASLLLSQVAKRSIRPTALRHTTLLTSRGLSSSAAAEEAPRRRKRSLDPIIVVRAVSFHLINPTSLSHIVFLKTESAASRIKELLQGESAEGAIGIRLGVKRRTSEKESMFDVHSF